MVYALYGLAQEFTTENAKIKYKKKRTSVRFKVFINFFFKREKLNH